jgi:hypothetical protein
MFNVITTSSVPDSRWRYTDSLVGLPSITTKQQPPPNPNKTSKSSHNDACNGSFWVSSIENNVTQEINDLLREIDRTECQDLRSPFNKDSTSNPAPALSKDDCMCYFRFLKETHHVLVHSLESTVRQPILARHDSISISNLIPIVLVCWMLMTKRNRCGLVFVSSHLQ